MAIKKVEKKRNQEKQKGNRTEKSAKSFFGGSHNLLLPSKSFRSSIFSFIFSVCGGCLRRLFSGRRRLTGCLAPCKLNKITFWLSLFLQLPFFSYFSGPCVLWFFFLLLLFIYFVFLAYCSMVFLFSQLHRCRYRYKRETTLDTVQKSLSENQLMYSKNIKFLSHLEKSNKGRFGNTQLY